MTTKRARVPAALHAELTEYANLVRALRTTRALDLTAHLIHDANATEGDSDKNAWTAWPLIDCPVPEWSLADEIEHLADAVAKHGPGDGCDADSGSDLDGVPSTAANRIVFHTASVLTRILSLLADQRPSAPGSMQNRLRQMDWEDVISLLAVSGLVDHSVVARAEKRLERIYGPCNTKAIQRLELVTAAKMRFSEFALSHEDQLFAPPVLHPRQRRRLDTTSTLGRHRTKTRAVIDTDTDLDA